MTADDAVVAVLDGLDAAGIPYMIVGSLASNFHGSPRSTRDAYVVVELAPGSLERLARRLPAELTIAPQGSFETVTGTIRHIVALAGSPFVCELFVRSDDPHDRERFARRVATRILDRPAYVASAEDMIVTKLRWGRDGRRSKDYDDVRNIVAVRDRDLDWPYIRRWTDAHGTTAMLESIPRSVP